MESYPGRPRILFWETEDERVQEVAGKVNPTFRPVFLEAEHEGSKSVAVLAPSRVVEVWNSQGKTSPGPPGDGAELGAAAVGLGMVDGAVGGVRDTSADVLRAGLRYIGASGTVSMAMLLVPPAGLPEARRVMLADCAVVPHPSSSQLAHIAAASAATWERVTSQAALVAFVGSNSRMSDSEEATRIRSAISILSRTHPRVVADGPLQIDAALVASIARRKDAQGPVAGRANVLVFPELTSANAGYKLLQHLGAFSVVPITQNMRRPFFDVSRGSSSAELAAAAEQCAAIADHSGPVVGRTAS